MPPDSVAGPTVEQAIALGSEYLRARSGEDARREALRLLSGLLDLSPARLWIERHRAVPPDIEAEYRERLRRRRAGEPLQYIEGDVAFRELSLRVEPSVLIPRPETEQLVGRVLEWARGRDRLHALDIGTGSGAIALSLLREGPFTAALAVDISARALKVAQANAREAGLEDRVEFRAGSFFEPVGAEERFDVIVSNPPYVARREAESLPEEVRDHEPPDALFAGPTGLEAIERIVEEAPNHLRPGGLLALEIAPGRAGATVTRLESRGAYRSVRTYRDHAGQLRIVSAERADSLNSRKERG